MSLGMTDRGHIIHAMSMFSQNFWLAWGNLPNGYPLPWTIGETPPVFDLLTIIETVTRGIGLGAHDTLGNTGVTGIISINQGAVFYAPGTNYTVSGNQITWLASSPSPPANSSTYTVIYQYDSTAITSILSELGRRHVTIKDYAIRDDAGPIQCNGQNWSLTGGTPTNAIYLNFSFDSSDAVGNIIYQIGLFVGTTLQAGVPGGTQYLLPAQILDPGSEYLAENLEPFSRFAGKREIFEIIVDY
jgi:hypothetical protein